MAAAAEKWNSWRGRALIAGLAFLLIVLLVAVGLLLANTHGAAQVAGNARGVGGSFIREEDCLGN